MSVEHSTLQTQESFSHVYKDDLQYKFYQMLIVSGGVLNAEEEGTFEEIFEEHAIKDQSIPYWTETSLTRYLRQQLPQNLTYHVVDAAPILYLSVIRLASYLLGPIRILTANALRTVAVLLCRRSSWAPRDQGLPGFSLDTLERNRLLFQSLVDKFATIQYNAPHDKDDENLNDLLDATDQDYDSVWHADVSDGFDEPNVLVHPKPRLQFSNTTELEGTIPRDTFRSWLRLVLLCRFDPVGDVRWRRELEAVTDSVLDCFIEHGTGHLGEGITWQAFDKAITDMMPLLHIGLANLFEPLIGRSNVPTTFSLMPGLSQLFSSFGENPKLRTDGNGLLPLQELSHPILCQLAIFLPIIDIREHTLLSGTDFIEYANERKSPGLMLLSGLGITSQNPETIGHVIYGAFFGALPDTDSPFDRAGQVCIFQLAPVHRVFVAARAPRTPGALDLTFSKEVARRGFKVELVTERSEMVELIIDGGMENASFAHWTAHQDEGSDRTLVGETRSQDDEMKSNELFGDFRIADMKLLGFPQQIPR